MMGKGNDFAVVIAAHGDRAGAAPNKTILSHRERLQSLGLFRVVIAGVLKGEPSLETALSEAAASGAARVAVVPFFMADGYFAGQVLPERIAAAGLTTRSTILQPLGDDPNLMGLMLEEAQRAAALHKFWPGETTLLVVGHGSKIGQASADATRRVAEGLAHEGVFARVTIGLLEESPFLADALAEARGPVVVSGFFSGDGLHAGEDVPKAIEASGARAVYAGPIGRSDQIAGLIRDAVLREALAAAAR